MGSGGCAPSGVQGQGRGVKAPPEAETIFLNAVVKLGFWDEICGESLITSTNSDPISLGNMSRREISTDSCSIILLCYYKKLLPQIIASKIQLPSITVLLICQRFFDLLQI